METQVEALTDLFCSLSVSENPVDSLLKIESILKSSSTSSFGELANDFRSYEVLFQLLNSSNSPELANPCCSILCELLKINEHSERRLPANESTSQPVTTNGSSSGDSVANERPGQLKLRLRPLLLSTFLQCQQPVGRIFCLQQLYPIIGCSQDVAAIPTEFISSLLDFHASSPTDFSMSEQLLETWGDTMPNPSALLSQGHEVGRKVTQLLSNNHSEPWFRIMKVIVSWSARNPVFLTAAHAEGHLPALIGPLMRGSGKGSSETVSDPLLLLCILEEVGQLSQTPHGSEYLERQGFCSALIGWLISHDSSSLESVLLRPGIVKFFGTTYLMGQSKWDFKPVFDFVLESLCTEPDDAIFQTLGALGEREEGKEQLSQSRHLDAALKALGSIIRTPGPERVRVLAMHTLAQLVKPSKETQQWSEEEISVTGSRLFSWFEAVLGRGEASSTFLLSVLDRQPPSLRVCVWSVLQAVLSLPQGVQWAGASQPLLTRMCRRGGQEELEIKGQYEAVSTLVQSASLRAHLEPRMQLELRRYWREGPLGGPLRIPGVSSSVGAQVAYAEGR